MSKYTYELKLKIARKNEPEFELEYLSKKYSSSLYAIKIWLNRYTM